MAFFRRSVPTQPLDELRTELASLRRAVGDLHSLCLDQDTAIKTLRQERTLRELELADLRTRFETIIKRVGARLDRTEDKAGDSSFELINRSRARR